MGDGSYLNHENNKEMKPINYKKLPGKDNGSFQASTLWLGPDHILLCKYTRFSESYKRFYFSDIQSIIVRKTNNGKITEIVIFLLATLFTLLYLTVPKGSQVLFGFIVGIYILMLIVHRIKGPTCTTHIQTAVQTESLRPLKRLKHAEKFLKILMPLLQTAQGTFTPKMMADKIEQYAVSPKAIGETPSKTDPNTLQVKGSPIHTTLFFLLICDGVVTLIQYSINHISITLISILLFVPLAILPIMALAKQSNTNINHPIKAITWCTLGHVCIGVMYGYISFFALSVDAAGKMTTANNWELIKMMSEISPQDHTCLNVYYLFSISLSFLLGILGLLFSARPRKRKIT